MSYTYFFLFLSLSYFYRVFILMNSINTNLKPSFSNTSSIYNWKPNMTFPKHLTHLSISSVFFSNNTHKKISNKIIFYTHYHEKLSQTQYAWKVLEFIDVHVHCAESLMCNGCRSNAVLPNTFSIPLTWFLHVLLFKKPDTFKDRSCMLIFFNISMHFS